MANPLIALSRDELVKFSSRIFSSVRECLQFAARLRQHANVVDKEKMEYVEKIIHLLGMSEYAEAIVGSIGRRLNWNKKRNCQLVLNWLPNPPFYCSWMNRLLVSTFSLQSIVQFLCSLAAFGQSILCTIHQPTLFEERWYFGDIGPNSSSLISSFERHGVRQCECNENLSICWNVWVPVRLLVFMKIGSTSGRTLANLWIPLQKLPNFNMI